jgi:hypothetical protein
MPLSRRYTPEIHPSESSVIGMSFEYIIPPGVGIASASVFVLYNQVSSPGPAADTLILLGKVQIRGRVLYAPITATPEAEALDFQIQWNANDTQGNVWWRTALLLCSVTS